MAEKQSKRVIVLTKTLTRGVGLQSLPLLRFMSKQPDVPVVQLKTDKDRLLWMMHVVKDLHHLRLSDYLQEVDTFFDCTPSQYFQMLKESDVRIPTFYLATETPNGYTHILKGSNREVNEIIREYMA